MNLPVCSVTASTRVGTPRVGSRYLSFSPCVFCDGRYEGEFTRGRYLSFSPCGLCDGRYEGEFAQGWFHGHGIFWRADGMRFEGELRGGRLWGHGERGQGAPQLWDSTAGSGSPIRR